MAGRRLRVTWEVADTAERLHRAYRAEDEGAVRMRLQALWLLRRGAAVGAAADAVGVSYRTVQRWVRWYEAGGLAAVRAHRQGGPGPRARLSAAQQEQVAAEVATGRFRSAAEIGAWIHTTFGVAYRPGGMSALLARLGCGPKVPRPVHAKADAAAQARWKKGGSRRPSRRSA